MLKKLLAVCAAALLTLTTYAVAVDLRDDHPETYVVQKGDTLWDIAARFLKQPWLWPEIWQANPQIENPHLIYPGDEISLAYLGGKPQLSVRRLSPEIRRTALDAVPTVPLAEIESFLRNLRIIDEDTYVEQGLYWSTAHWPMLEYVAETYHPDLLLVGNNFGPEPTTGRFDGGLGLVLKGDGHGGFTALLPADSGVQCSGEARSAVVLPGAKGARLVVACTQGPVQLFERK